MYCTHNLIKKRKTIISKNKKNIENFLLKIVTAVKIAVYACYRRISSIWLI